MKMMWAVGVVAGALAWGGAAAGADMLVTRNAYGEIRQTTVGAGDLDLTRAEGAEQLLARLEYAAVRVCDADNMNWSLRLYEQHRACVRNTMDRAVASVPAPLVRHLYAADIREDR